MALWMLQGKLPSVTSLPDLLREWREDGMQFIRLDAPKIILIIAGAYALIWLLRVLARKSAALHIRKLPAGRVQQVKTVSSVLTSIGVFVISFVAFLMVLGQLGLNLGPMLASAGIAGLAIGFGAQALVHDFINGFFILFENQYDIGDVVRIAGVKGTVEHMSLRTTILRDEDGTVHTVPNSSIQIVSNTTRDWSQLAMRVTVVYTEPSDRIVGLLKQVGEDLRHDEAFAPDIAGDISVPGIDRVGNGEAEYLVLIKTLPTKQYPVSREMRRLIKEVFEKNNVQAAGPGRIYVMDQGAPKAS